MKILLLLLDCSKIVFYAAIFMGAKFFVKKISFHISRFNSRVASILINFVHKIILCALAFYTGKLIGDWLYFSFNYEILDRLSGIFTFLSAQLIPFL
jgi:hypothetical protein